MMKHKGFLGSVHFDAGDEVFHGRIEGISGLVTFEGQSVEELKAAFHSAVEDYEPVKKSKQFLFRHTGESRYPADSRSYKDTGPRFSTG